MSTRASGGSSSSRPTGTAPRPSCSSQSWHGDSARATTALQGPGGYSAAERRQYDRSRRERRPPRRRRRRLQHLLHRGQHAQGLNVSFITKLIHFAGYESEHRPRPLIYDKLVATAITRLPTAPLLPDIEDLTTVAYKRYCQWAQDTATEHGTEPAVVEWALFALGEEIRDELRAERAPRRRSARKRTDR